MSTINKFIILTGPSCQGKTLLLQAVKHQYPQLTNAIKQLVFLNDRPIRPGEVDGISYHYSTTEYIQSLHTNPDYLICEVRSDLQAISISSILSALDHSTVLFEGSTYVANRLINLPAFSHIDFLSTFISPLSIHEVTSLKDTVDPDQFEQLITNYMYNKLTRRSIILHDAISDQEREDIKVRAKSAYKELKLAHQFNYVLPNHDGEDSDNWSTFPFPIGDAANVVEAFSSIINNVIPGLAETWPKTLFS